MTIPVEAESIVKYFDTLADPRVNRMRPHNLKNIIAITILGVICGAGTWTEIEEFGEVKED